MTWVAVGVGVAGLAGSLMGGAQQKSAADKASRLQQAQYEQTRAQTLADYSPFLNQGQISLGQLGKLTAPGGALMQPFGMKQFQQDPGYQFQLQQGQQAINKGAAARGQYYAPQTLQDLGKFQQGLASTSFQDAYQRYMQQQQQQYNMLQGLTGEGLQAAGGIAGLGGLGAGAASLQGQLGVLGAGAQAAGLGTGLNALAGGVLGGFGAGAYNQALQGQQQPTVGGFNTPMGNSWWQGQQDPNAWTVG